MPRGRKKKVISEAEMKPGAVIPVDFIGQEIEVKKEEPKPKLNPQPPLILRFVCATCHTCQTMRYVDGKLTENRAYNMLTGVGKTIEGIPLIEMLCLRCGTVSWKLSPEITDKKTLALYPNLALKRG